MWHSQRVLQVRVVLHGLTEIIANNNYKKVIEDLSEQYDPCSAATEFEHQFQVSQMTVYTISNNTVSEDRAQGLLHKCYH